MKIDGWKSAIYMKTLSQFYGFLQKPAGNLPNEHQSDYMWEAHGLKWFGLIFDLKSEHSWQQVRVQMCFTSKTSQHTGHVVSPTFIGHRSSICGIKIRGLRLTNLYIITLFSTIIFLIPHFFFHLSSLNWFFCPFHSHKSSSLRG